MQIRARITVQFLIIVAIILFLAKAYIYFEVRRHIINEHYSTLRSKSNLTAATAIAQLERTWDNTILPMTLSGSRSDFFTENVTIYKKDGTPVFTLTGVAERLDSKWHGSLYNQEKEVCIVSGSSIYVIQPFISTSGRSYIVKGEALFDRRELNLFILNLVILYFAFLSVVALSGWLFAGRALKPVNQIMDELNAVFPGDMRKRLHSITSRDELGRLVDSFNQLLDRIQQAFDAQKSFLAQVSHELKNPFTIIMTQTDIALQQERTNDEYKVLLGSILEDVKEVNRITDNLMQLSRIEAGNLEANFKVVRIDDLVFQLRDQFKKLKPHFNIGVRFGDIAGDDRVLNVTGNEDLLRSAFYNLMDNGCKYSPDNHVLVELRVNHQGGLCVDFVDNGPGIDLEDTKFIFDPFYRSKTVTHMQGHGIGLSLVKRIAQLHNIALEVLPHIPTGTRFSLHFPKGT